MPEYYCPVCRDALTEQDIREERAVRRGDEVYCLAHFRQSFPWECEEHPGTEGKYICTGCGRIACDSCTIELLGHLICTYCKEHWNDRMAVGKEPPRFRINLRDKNLHVKVPNRRTFWRALKALVIYFFFCVFSVFSLYEFLPISMLLFLWLLVLVLVIVHIFNPAEKIGFEREILTTSKRIWFIKRLKMKTADIKGFILRPPRFGRYDIPVFSYEGRERVFLFATSEEIPPGQSVLRTLPPVTQMKVSVFFGRYIPGLFKWNKPNLLLAEQANEEELKYLQNILSRHLRRLQVSFGGNDRD